MIRSGCYGSEILLLLLQRHLVAAVGIVYTQHIGTIFKRKPITVKGIDAIIAAPNDVFTLLNGEMWLKNLVGTSIAGLLWLLPLAITILPPASLSDVSYASAINVNVIPMDAPFPSVSYFVDFYGPAFNCTLEKFDRPQTTQSNAVEVYNFSNATSNVLSFYTLLKDKYIQCALYNTSFHTQFSFENGIQSARNVLEFINPVKYPNSSTDTRDIPSSLAYQGWMDPISDMLKGNLYLNRASDAVAWYSGIGLTELVYSSDIRPMLPTQLADDPSIGTEQLFRPLEDLLEEFSANLTLSLFSSSVLSPSVYDTTVTVTSPVNNYKYSQENLILPYLASFACSLLAVFVGAWAFKMNGKSQNTSFSSILCTTRDGALDELVGDDSLGALPLNPRIAKTKLQFALVKRRQNAHWAFQLN